MKKQTQTQLSASVMDQIKGGKVRMKPRSYYTLLTTVAAGAVVASGLTLAYLSSIVFFWLKIQTAETMAFGARMRLSDAIASFPWWALLLATVLLAASVMLVRHQGRMYKHRTSTIVLVIVAGALLLGLIFSLFDIGKPDHPAMQPGRGPGWQRMR